MSSVPSIKGSVFSGVVEDVNKLLQSGLCSGFSFTCCLYPARYLSASNAAMHPVAALIQAWR